MQFPLSRRMFVRNTAALVAGGVFATRSSAAAVSSTPVSPVTSGSDASTAAVLVDELLAAMGGRAAWAAVTFMHVEALHDDLAIRDPFTNRIWNDFTTFRVRFAAHNASFDSR